MEQFSCGTKLILGPGALDRLEQLQPERLLVVTDPFFGENGKAQALAEHSGAKEWKIFDRVQPDPSVELVAEGTVLLRQFSPDTVVALGGGSAMDCAKAMVYFSGLDVQLVAVPTTSGSGSEVTDFAILTHGSVKYPLVDTRLRPDVAILDDSLLEQLPRSLIADGGFDAISHALEALVAKNANPITDALARAAFRTVFGELIHSQRGDLQARRQIHIAATMAAMAFSQAGLGLCHAMSHSLGGAFHIPHGRLNGILLPSVIGCNRPGAEKYAALAREIGLGGSTEQMAVRNLKNGLIRLRTQLQMPADLKEAGVEPQAVEAQAEAVVAAAVKDPCCRTNPVEVDAPMVRKILEEVTGRG